MKTIEVQTHPRPVLDDKDAGSSVHSLVMGKKSSWQAVKSTVCGLLDVHGNCGAPVLVIALHHVACSCGKPSQLSEQGIGYAQHIGVL